MFDDHSDGPGPPGFPADPGPDQPAGGPDLQHHHYRRLEHLAHALGADDDLPIDPDLSPDDDRLPSRHHRAGARGARPRRGGRRGDPWTLAVIFAGGFAGTLARYVVEDAWTSPAGHFPTATFAINTSGAFVLGLLLTVLLERLRARHRLVRPFAVTGVLGGWTTYSTMVVEAVTIGHAGDVTLAAGYLAVTLVCGITGVALGIALGRSRRLDGLTSVAPTAWVPVATGEAAAAPGDAEEGPAPGAPGYIEVRR